MGESRQELLGWLNDLTGLGVKKVEEFGKGYACAQVLDSIYGDVALRKVDFNPPAEYRYLQNWKVVQATFTKHKIDRVIPVEQLVKCRMQDNLEFLQWCKRHWEQYFPGGEYDAASRRGGSATPASTRTASAAQPVLRAGASQSRTASTSTNTSTASAQQRRAATTTIKEANASSSRPSSNARSGATARATATGTVSAATAGRLHTLEAEAAELHECVAGLEKERDFYFNKLRDIEILIQAAVETNPAASSIEDGILTKIQEIMYSTEEGFEVPEPSMAEEVPIEASQLHNPDANGSTIHNDGVADDADEVF
ncbi:microtubule integrity protein mal3 [Savitreella phatthalungensis]